MPENKVDSTPSDPLLQAMDKLGTGSNFLWMIFIFTLTPTIFNGMHSISYIFIADIPTHWCSIPALTAANWTNKQIRNISSSSPCTMYNYDYDYFAHIGFQQALEYKITHTIPKSVECEKRNFEEGIYGTSLVEDWDLVCDKRAARSSTHMALSLGKLLGSAVFGILADEYGRKTSYVIGMILLMTSGPLGAVVPWYWAFMATRLFNGVSHAAIQYSSFTILTEVADEKHRQWMGIAYNIGYASGIVIIPGIAYLLPDWRHVQLAISLPALLMLVNTWFMPESPRWLIAQNRRKRAKEIIDNACKGMDNAAPSTTVALVERDQELKASRNRRMRSVANSVKEELKQNIVGFKVLLTNSELRKRVLITNFSWMVASLCYYALALNLNNFSANQYIYVLMMGLTEIPAYVLPSSILMLIGRRTGCSALYIIAALCLLCILLIPTTDDDTIMIISLIGRFSSTAGYGIGILHSSELFPTVCRNSAMGLNSAMSHVGSVASPYVADLLSLAAWWGPTTLCGALSLLAGLLCAILPETRGRPLANTMEEELTEERANVSLANFLKFR